jgi:hypothetical protein
MATGMPVVPSMMREELLLPKVTQPGAAEEEKQQLPSTKPKRSLKHQTSNFREAPIFKIQTSPLAGLNGPHWSVKLGN